MNKASKNGLKVGVIGAGPVGLAAGAHLVSRGITPVIFERGDSAGHAIRSWGHVKIFSPWFYNMDSAAQNLLKENGWIAPNPEALPTGDELVEKYLEPLSRHPKIATNLHLKAEVISITRKGLDKLTTSTRENAPFIIRWKNEQGEEKRTEVGAVIDASGTWFSPNPMGVDGNKIEGEQKAGEKIHYGIPNVLNRDRQKYANKRVLVTGAGHSAINTVLDLLQLQEIAPQTKVIWSLRRNRLEKLFGGGLNDKLPARGALGQKAKSAIEQNRLELLVPFEPQKIEPINNSLLVTGIMDDRLISFEVDLIVVATGFRPNLQILREIRTSLDPVLEAPPALAPLIDPNLHSCGTVPPHGVEELKHPSEPGFYIVGSKSYGRAPTFLMATGYEQVRSVVAEIAGDYDAARDVRLVLPETGVCSASPGKSTKLSNKSSGKEVPITPIQINAPKPQSSCCGGPSPADDGACCLKDHDAKASGAEGCGCNSKPISNTPTSELASACCSA